MIHDRGQSLSLINTLGNGLKEIYKDRSRLRLPVISTDGGDLNRKIDESISLTLVNYEDKPISSYRESSHLFFNAASESDLRSNQCKLVELEFLIRGSVGGRINPKSCLVMGPAGIGKSTLCHQIAYLWSHGKLWPEIQAIIWLPLKSIEAFGNSETIARWVWNECFQQRYVSLELVNALFERGDLLKSCLFLLDGYDEVASQIEANSTLKSILTMPFKLVTSRPHARPDADPDIKFDSIIENQGFKESDIFRYIKLYFENNPESLSSLTAYLEKNSKIRAVCAVPLNLYLLCDLWSEEGPRKNKDISCTKLYSHFMKVILNKAAQNSKKINQQWQSPELIEEKYQNILAFLGRVAFEQMDNKEQMKISKGMIFSAQVDGDITLSHLVETGLLVPAYLDARLREPKFYSFIHSTFHEFLAAKYIVSCIKSDNREIQTEILKFISRRKYDSNFTSILVFVIGLICREKLGDWHQKYGDYVWDALLSHDNDMVGLQHQTLMILALEESGSSIPEGVPIKKIKQDLMKWIMFSINPSQKLTLAEEGLRKVAIESLSKALSNAPSVAGLVFSKINKMWGMLNSVERSMVMKYYFSRCADSGVSSGWDLLENFYFNPGLKDNLGLLYQMIPWGKFRYLKSIDSFLGALLARLKIEIIEEKRINLNYVAELINVFVALYDGENKKCIECYQLIIEFSQDGGEMLKSSLSLNIKMLNDKVKNTSTAMAAFREYMLNSTNNQVSLDLVRHAVKNARLLVEDNPAARNDIIELLKNMHNKLAAENTELTHEIASILHELGDCSIEVMSSKLGLSTHLEKKYSLTSIKYLTNKILLLFDPEKKHSSLFLLEDAKKYSSKMIDVMVNLFKTNETSVTLLFEDPWMGGSIANYFYSAIKAFISLSPQASLSFSGTLFGAVSVFIKVTQCEPDLRKRLIDSLMNMFYSGSDERACNAVYAVVFLSLGYSNNRLNDLVDHLFPSLCFNDISDISGVLSSNLSHRLFAISRLIDLSPIINDEQIKKNILMKVDELFQFYGIKSTIKAITTSEVLEAKKIYDLAKVIPLLSKALNLLAGLNLNEKFECYDEAFIVIAIFSSEIDHESFESVFRNISNLENMIDDEKLSVIFLNFTKFSSLRFNSKLYFQGLYRLWRVLPESSLFCFKELLKKELVASKNINLQLTIRALLSIIILDNKHIVTNHDLNDMCQSVTCLVSNDKELAFDFMDLLAFEQTEEIGVVMLCDIWVSMCLYNSVSLEIIPDILVRSERFVPQAIKIKLCDSISFMLDNAEANFVVLQRPFLQSLVRFRCFFTKDDFNNVIFRLIKLLNKFGTISTLEMLSAIENLVVDIPESERLLVSKELILSVSDGDEVVFVDTYTQIVSSAKRIYESISPRKRDLFMLVFKDLIRNGKPPLRLALLSMLVHTKEFSSELYGYLLVLLGHAQWDIAMSAINVFVSLKGVDYRLECKESLAYMLNNISTVSMDERREILSVLKKWFFRDKNNFLNLMLLVLFNEEGVLKSVELTVFMLNIEFKDLLSAYHNFLENLDAVSLSSLIKDRYYVFTPVVNFLMTEGFVLKERESLVGPHLCISKYNGIGYDEVNFVLSNGSAVLHREIIKCIFHILSKKLSSLYLPVAHLESIFKYQIPRYIQRSSINFFDDIKVILWGEFFHLSPQIVQNQIIASQSKESLRCYKIEISRYVECYVKDLSADDCQVLIDPENSHVVRFKIKNVLKSRELLDKFLNAVVKNSQYNYIDLSENGLRDDVIEVLIERYECMDNVSTIILSDNNVTELGLDRLLHRAMSLPNLRYLFMDNNNISFSKSTKLSSPCVLLEKTNLIYLDLSLNFIPVDELKALSHPIRANQKIMVSKKLYDHFDANGVSGDTFYLNQQQVKDCRQIHSSCDKRWILSVLDPSKFVNSNFGVLARMANRVENFDVHKEHSFLLIEDIDVTTGQRRILRAELFSSKGIKICLQQISKSDFDKIQKSSHCIGAASITAIEIEVLIGAVKQSIRSAGFSNYSPIPGNKISTYNCAKWDEEMINKAGFRYERAHFFPSHEVLSRPCSIL